MAKVYIVHRYVSYAYPDNNIEDRWKSIDKVFDTEAKAIDYIRKEIVEWHRSCLARHQSVEPIEDETYRSYGGIRACFLGMDEGARVFRNLYYIEHDIQ